MKWMLTMLVVGAGSFLTDVSSYTYVSVFSASEKTCIDVGGGHVIFNNVSTNVGYSYDATTGVYTTPRKGLYAFHVTLLPPKCGCWTLVEIAADGVQLATLLPRSDPNYKEQASASCVQVLEKGAKVSVFAWANKQLFGDKNEQFGIFSGYLVAAM